jgi:hypothetical protein
MPGWNVSCPKCCTSHGIHAKDSSNTWVDYVFILKDLKRIPRCLDTKTFHLCCSGAPYLFFASLASFIKYRHTLFPVSFGRVCHSKFCCPIPKYSPKITKICPSDSLGFPRHLTLLGLAIVREHCELADLWQRGTAASVAGASCTGRLREGVLRRLQIKNNLVNLSMFGLSASFISFS